MEKDLMVFIICLRNDAIDLTQFLEELGAREGGTELVGGLEPGAKGTVNGGIEGEGVGQGHMHLSLSSSPLVKTCNGLLGGPPGRRGCRKDAVGDNLLYSNPKDRITQKMVRHCDCFRTILLSSSLLAALSLIHI